MTVLRLSAGMLNELSASAARSARCRQHYNLHASYEEPCQRLLNAIGMDSYIRPHRHGLDPKAECLIALRGLFALVVFDDEGAIREMFRFGTEKYFSNQVSSVAVELPPATWHTVIALVPDSILFELKAGPFDPMAAKELAPWAPEEGAPEAVHYLRGLRDLSAKLAVTEP